MALTKPECKELASHFFIMLDEFKDCEENLYHGYSGAAFRTLESLSEATDLAYKSEDITKEEHTKILSDIKKLQDYMLPPTATKESLEFKYPPDSSLKIINKMINEFEHFIVDKIVECQCP